MSQVEFSEEEAYKAEINRRTMTMGSGAKPWNLLEIPKKLGLATDETGSHLVLAIVAAVAVVAAVIIFILAP